MKSAWFLLAVLVAQPASAWACSIAPDPRPLEEQRDASARLSYPRAEALVEVVAVQGSRWERPGIMRVTRVLKGPIRQGQLLRLRSVESSMCGAGDFRRGARGLILIDRLRGPLFFQGFLPDDYLTRLDRLGLRPIRTPALRR